MSVVVPNQQANVAPSAVDRLLARPPSNLWRDAALRFSKNKLAMAALIIVLLLVFMAVFADLIAPNPNRSILSDTRLFPAQKGYVMGTDDVGRDLLKRIIHGTRTSL